MAQKKEKQNHIDDVAQGKACIIHISTTIKTPDVPTSIEIGGGEKIALTSIPDSALRRIGKAWTESLISKKRELENYREDGKK